MRDIIAPFIFLATLMFALALVAQKGLDLQAKRQCITDAQCEAAYHMTVEEAMRP